MVTTTGPGAARIATQVGDVPDPELPMVTIADLGILRRVDVAADGAVAVTITPTYSGCPAMDAIRADIRAVLAEAGHERAEVVDVLSPAWTTDRMSAEARQKLAEAGIAPPSGDAPVRSGPVLVRLSVPCPQCGSPDTEELSRFGSTACKALHRCRSCLEPFDHFKSH